MKLLWPTLLAISTASLCLGLLDGALDWRGEARYVRPFHHGVVLVAVLTFWPAYRCIAWFRRRGAFPLSVFFVSLVLSIWTFTLPLGDRIAIHFDYLDPNRDLVRSVPGAFYRRAWFYHDDSGNGGRPMSISHLTLTLWPFPPFGRPWIPVLFLAFFPCFFYLHRNSNAPKRLTDVSVEGAFLRIRQHTAVLSDRKPEVSRFTTPLFVPTIAIILNAFFHAIYGGHEALIEIETGAVHEGY